MADGDISMWCQFPELAPHIDQWMLSLHSILGSIVDLKSNVTIGPIFVCMVNIPMPYEKQSLSNAQYSIFGTWYPIFFREVPQNTIQHEPKNDNPLNNIALALLLIT